MARDTTLVVVAYHRPEALRELLAHAADPAVAVVVVNVEADPDVAAVAAEAGAEIVEVPENCGFAAGVNRGVAQASTPTVVVTNDDVLIAGATVRALAARVGEGVAVPAIVDTDGERQPTIASLPTLRGLALEWMALPDHPIRGLGWLRPEKWRRPTGRERVHAASAAVFASTVALLTDVPLPEDYFLYWEESDWFFRLAGRDVVVLYDADLIAVHRGGRDDVRSDKARLMARNAVRCVRRTQGRVAAMGAWPIVVVWNVRLAIVDLVRGLVGSSSARSRLKARWAGVAAALAAVAEIR